MKTIKLYYIWLNSGSCGFFGALNRYFWSGNCKKGCRRNLQNRCFFILKNENPKTLLYSITKRSLGVFWDVKSIFLIRKLKKCFLKRKNRKTGIFLSWKMKTIKLYYIWLNSGSCGFFGALNRYFWSGNCKKGCRRNLQNRCFFILKNENPKTLLYSITKRFLEVCQDAKSIFLVWELKKCFLKRKNRKTVVFLFWKMKIKIFIISNYKPVPGVSQDGKSIFLVRK